MRYILAILVMVLLVGCVAEAPVSAPDNMDEQMAKSDNKVINDNQDDEVEAVVETESVDELEAESTMRQCTNAGKGQPVEMTYYFSEGAIYEKADVDGDINEKVITKTQVCVKMDSVQVDGWNCVETDQLEESRESYEMQTTGTMGDVLKFSCKDVPFDASVFSVE